MICRTDHATLKMPAQWFALPLLGVQRTPADDATPEEHLELRNCPECHSTLAVLVAVDARAA